MGYEELNVIDPTTGKPVKAETDMSDVRRFSFLLCFSFPVDGERM